jgi:hypothetical protein
MGNTGACLSAARSDLRLRMPAGPEAVASRAGVRFPIRQMAVRDGALPRLVICEAWNGPTPASRSCDEHATRAASAASAVEYSGRTLNNFTIEKRGRRGRVPVGSRRARGCAVTARAPAAGARSIRTWLPGGSR